MSTISGEEYLSSGQYGTDMDTIKGLADQINSAVIAMFPGGGSTFTSNYEDIVGPVKETLIAKVTDIKTYCDQVKISGEHAANFLAATKET
jgi:hypothetical protein